MLVIRIRCVEFGVASRGGDEIAVADFAVIANQLDDARASHAG
jgi:hypothetical protein